MEKLLEEVADMDRKIDWLFASRQDHILENLIDFGFLYIMTTDENQYKMYNYDTNEECCVDIVKGMYYDENRLRRYHSRDIISKKKMA